MVIGGSLGAKVINDAVRAGLHQLLETYQICHICGKGGLDSSLENTAGYRQFEYVREDLPHLFAMSDVVISRAGANALFELFALRKPNLLIPLSQKASRGDQILNARSFVTQGFSHLLEEEDLTPESLQTALAEVYKNRESYRLKMNENPVKNGVEAVINVIQDVCKKRTA